MSEDKLDRERNKAIGKAGEEVAASVLKGAKLIAAAIRESREPENENEFKKRVWDAVIELEMKARWPQGYKLGGADDGERKRLTTD